MFDREGVTKILVVGTGGTILGQPAFGGLRDWVEEVNGAASREDKVPSSLLGDGLRFHVCSLSNTPRVLETKNPPEHYIKVGHLFRWLSDLKPAH